MRLIIHGSFVDQAGIPITGAAVHYRFLGDALTGFGTSFDVTDAICKTDRSGWFEGILCGPDGLRPTRLLPGTGGLGFSLLLAVKDARTLGYAVNRTDEIDSHPIDLVAVSLVDLQGKVVDEGGISICGARVAVSLYLLAVVQEKTAGALVNFWLSYSNSTMRETEQLGAYTRTDGTFVIPGVPRIQGGLQLTIAHPGFAALETNYWFQGEPEFTLRQGALVEVLVRLPEKEPAAGLALHLEGDAEDAYRCTTHRRGETDERGCCRFAELFPGEYTIRYVGGGDQGIAIPAFKVTALRKGETREICLTASEGIALKGRVLAAETGEPVGPAEIRFESLAYPNTSSTAQAVYTGKDGKYEFPYSIIPGPITVWVTLLGEGPRKRKRYELNLMAGSPTDYDFAVG